MVKQTFNGLIRDIIATISWKTFLWAIKMTDKEYWYECYKLERNRMCIEDKI